jgi:hypothetical protein
MEMPAMLSLTIGSAKTNLKNFLPLLSLARDLQKALCLAVAYPPRMSHTIRLYCGDSARCVPPARAGLYRGTAGRGRMPRPAL